ncbi:MAG: hypothetical protein ABL903_09805 [Methylococcales bacterium]
MSIFKFLVLGLSLASPLLAGAAVTNFSDVDVSWGLGYMYGTPNSSTFPLKDHPGTYAHESGDYTTNIGQTDYVGVDVHTNSRGMLGGVSDFWQLVVNEGELVNFKFTSDVNDFWVWGSGPRETQGGGTFAVTVDNVDFPAAPRTTSAISDDGFGDRFFTEEFSWSNIPAGVYDFSVNGSTILNYKVTTSVSAVPVPAAFWLMGSGLMALISFGKRKVAVLV